MGSKNISTKIDFIGIGASKAGSTWLARCLDEHPEVHIPRIKEIEYFVVDRNVSTYRRGMEWYLSFFPKETSKKVGEISTAYIKSGNTAKLIKKDLPNVKIFATLRNPIDKIYSQFWYLRSISSVHNTPNDFQDFIEERPEFLEDGLLGKQMAAYFGSFSKQDIMCILLEDIKEDPEEVTQKVYRFLGVDPAFKPDSARKKVNSSISLRMKFMSRFLDYIIVTLNKFGVGVEVRRYLSKLGLMHIVFGILYKRKPYPPMSDKVRKMLASYYKDDISKLSDLIDRDLSHWLKI